MKIGLTGGIGCGKSSFASLLANRGWRVLQSDLIARNILETPEVAARIGEMFGPKVLDAKGKPDRAALAGVVFSDPVALAGLESVLHPLVRAKWLEECALAGRSALILETPLLFEKNLEADFDLTVCVHCSPGTQLSRLQARGLSSEQSVSRIRAQLPNEEKVRRSRHSVFNEGSADFLSLQADWFSGILKKKTEI